jgi:hypothetical protein
VLAGLAFFALALGGAAGCAKRATTTEAQGADGVTTLSAASFSRGTGRRGGRDARTLSAGRGLLDFGHKAGPETPLDQLLAEGDRPLPSNGLCPPDMASVDDLYCVDKFEASLVEILPNGEERPWSPYVPVDDGKEGNGARSKFAVRAVSERGVIPQAYISEMQAKEACGRSGKRLCKPAEWRKACMGPNKSTYGYGNNDEPRRCNDHGRSPIAAVFGVGSYPASGAPGGEESQRTLWTWPKMNDPELNQISGTLAQTGQFGDCVNGYGIHDMVGNIHEWVDDPEGTFLGGYYQDTHLNGDGCQYRTMAHAAWYHDYSTGFRCCADVGQ